MPGHFYAVVVLAAHRVYIHAGSPALPAATLTSDDLRGDVTIEGNVSAFAGPVTATAL